MSLSLKGRSILITGASMGIGESLAREMARQGADLILVARSEALLKKLCQELQSSGTTCRYFTCDLAQASEVEDLGEKILALGQLDGIVHNAGVGIYGEFSHLSDLDIRGLFEINFFSILSLTRILLPLLKNSPVPRILTVSSVVSWRGIPRMSPYCASKAALSLFVESLRVELKKHRIKLINTYPGQTRTDFSVNAKSKGWRPFSTEGSGTPPAKVAKKLVRAYIRGKRDEYVSLSNRMLIWLNFFFPKLLDWSLEKYFRNR